MDTPPRPIASYYTESTATEDNPMNSSRSNWGLAEILAEFRDAAVSKREMGDRFERLMVE